jgi:hypothetical protein
MPFISMLMIAGWTSTVAMIGLCALHDSDSIR